MPIFNLLRQRILTVVILAVILLLPTLSSAEEYKNIGFKKNVPKELKQKFPICDEFLDVKWIDITGKLKIEYYENGEKVNSKMYIGKLKIDVYRNNEKKGPIYLLVLLNKPLSIRMDERSFFVFYRITKQDYSGVDFERFLDGSTFDECDASCGRAFAFKAVVEKGAKQKVLILEIIPSPTNNESFGRFSKNICGLYPDEKVAIIEEVKQPFKSNNLTEELKHKYELIVSFANKKCLEIKQAYEMKVNEAKQKNPYPYAPPEIHKCLNTEYYVKNASAIDINLDGHNEYFFVLDSLRDQGPPLILVYYSRNNKYEFKDVGMDGCALSGHKFLYSAEGKAFYGNSKCNLTELLKGGN